MSYRDVLFHYDGSRVLHLQYGWQPRLDDPRGMKVFPACAARSDRRAITLWRSEERHTTDLRPCANCARTLRHATAFLNALVTDVEPSDV